MGIMPNAACVAPDQPAEPCQELPCLLRNQEALQDLREDSIAPPYKTVTLRRLV
ncbi:hypothetical protein DPMN_001057 [Dreissena polymorpha]|uniref:Uncharacterized protein n=1 Tax=Dreissena polymorpha TaxID=45954 RepID=A0A9D4MKZ8_DREPO|nr:hypothetical protein DPMN_001057 [Dreissena polymorpha]